MSPSDDFILDIGSHSIKLYRRREGNVSLLATYTWEVLEIDASPKIIERHIDTVLETVGADPDDASRRLAAIGTAAMRRNPALRTKIEETFAFRQLSYTTISQDDEAKLLRSAISSGGIPADADVVNVGGGSIQIISRDHDQPTLLPFGISDLNARFELNGPPKRRRLRECTRWVLEQLDKEIGPFCYVGGEKRYLEHFRVPLTAGYCERSHFDALTSQLASWDLAKLQHLSPFDPKWMNGALASNCIVTALFQKSRQQWFLPSDLNIANGFIEQINAP